MMSQKRQEAKDRLRSENDYRVNLKAELEIRHLHEKIDHMLTRQWERLAEMQQIQIEIMQELAVGRDSVFTIRLMIPGAAQKGGTEFVRNRITPLSPPPACAFPS